MTVPFDGLIYLYQHLFGFLLKFLYIFYFARGYKEIVTTSMMERFFLSSKNMVDSDLRYSNTLREPIYNVWICYKIMIKGRCPYSRAKDARFFVTESCGERNQGYGRRGRKELRKWQIMSLNWWRCMFGYERKIFKFGNRWAKIFASGSKIVGWKVEVQNVEVLRAVRRSGVLNFEYKSHFRLLRKHLWNITHISIGKSIRSIIHISVPEKQKVVSQRTWLIRNWSLLSLLLAFLVFTNGTTII